MAGLLGDASAQLAMATEAASVMNGKLEEPDHSSSNWYFGRDEIEKHSPSRKDGIDLKKETYFRKSYCTFLQDLGMRLKVPQVTIATAIVFCHRFFHRQSHHKNDRHMIATICMFLAGKVEETPRPLREVIMFSYEIRFKKDPVAVNRIKQKDVYEEQKELVLAGERLLLTTLGFDLNIHHPYKPLVAAIKKFKVAQNTLAQVAWNFVNDGLRTSLCLQFKPHHIAAGAIFLAAKFLKVKLPSDGDKVWWQEFEVTPRQLEEVSNQMLELYEQNKSNGVTGSQLTDPSPSTGDTNNMKGPPAVHTPPDALATSNGYHRPDSPLALPPATDTKEIERLAVKTEEVTYPSNPREEEYVPGSAPLHSGPSIFSEMPKDSPSIRATSPAQAPENGDGHHGNLEGMANSDCGRPAANGIVTSVSVIKQEVLRKIRPEEGQLQAELRGHREVVEGKMKSDPDSMPGRVRLGKLETPEDGKTGSLTAARVRREEADDWLGEDTTKCKPTNVGVKVETVEGKVKTEELKVKTGASEEEPKKSWVSLDEVNKDKVKAAMEKRRKSRGRGVDAKPAAVKVEPTNEDELLERELESGVEAAAEAEKAKQDRPSRKTVKVDHDLAGVKERAVEGDQVMAATRNKLREEDGGDSVKVEENMADVKERLAEGELVAGAKRKRLKDEDGPINERNQVKSLQRDVSVESVDRVKKAWSVDRAEEGEVPVASVAPRSPRLMEKCLPSPAGHLERSVSPVGQKRHYGGRDQYGARRDGHKDSRHVPYTREHYHHHSSSSHHSYHQHRPEADRDRHRDHKDREWAARDHKKGRHDHSN